MMPVCSLWSSRSKLLSLSPKESLGVNEKLDLDSSSDWPLMGRIIPMPSSITTSSKIVIATTLIPTYFQLWSADLFSISRPAWELICMKNCLSKRDPSHHQSERRRRFLILLPFPDGGGCSLQCFIWPCADGFEPQSKFGMNPRDARGLLPNHNEKLMLSMDQYL